MGAARWADAEAAARAVDRVRPLIDAALACRAMGESGFLHVVVMDPLAAGLPFEQAVLYEESFGDPPPLGRRLRGVRAPQGGPELAHRTGQPYGAGGAAAPGRPGRDRMGQRVRGGHRGGGQRAESLVRRSRGRRHRLHVQGRSQGRRASRLNPLIASGGGRACPATIPRRRAALRAGAPPPVSPRHSRMAAARPSRAATSRRAGPPARTATETRAS